MHDSHLTQNVCAESFYFFLFCWDLVDDLCFLLQASDTISVSSNPQGLVQVVKSPRQRLPSGSQALIKWAGEHGYNPITSYTNTPVANHFSIQLREPGTIDSPTDVDLTRRTSQTGNWQREIERVFGWNSVSTKYYFNSVIVYLYSYFSGNLIK